ncbi:MAG: hypothetical protein CMG62_10575 [Candidatus Marinimicrobia bacterium]|nr:hypothetical protein [Candidatus Neomarinimicrobiota bacterium]|tara:strand:- start:1499 stop:2407 length:909 start_codon:yes stop_codon:yes gene_type:complete
MIYNVLMKSFGIYLIFFFLTGCLIEDVEQPSEIDAGAVFTSILNISAIAEEVTNPHHGVIGVLHPVGWEFESGTFESTDPETPTGNIILDPYNGKKWICTEEQFLEDSLDFSTCADIDTVIGINDGMMWTFLMSDVGDYYGADAMHEVTLNFNTESSVSGEYPIGYITTVNTWGMLDFLNSEENADDPNMTDTSMNHILNVVGGSVGLDNNIFLPKSYYLSQNYPNPFNPESVIQFYISNSEFARIAIYDLKGRMVKLIKNEFLDKGQYELNINAGDLNSGVYYYQLKTKSFIDTKKMTILK